MLFDDVHSNIRGDMPAEKRLIHDQRGMPRYTTPIHPLPPVMRDDSRQVFNRVEHLKGAVVRAKATLGDIEKQLKDAEHELLGARVSCGFCGLCSVCMMK